MEKKSNIDRFNEKWKECQKTGCWIWIASKRGIKNKKGKRCENRVDYGNFWYNGKNHKANRIAYLFYKRDPGKKFVLHKCHNSMCVNPDHLYLGTHKQNMKDMTSVKRQARGNKVVNQHDYKELKDWEVKKIRKEYPLRSCTRAKYAEKWGITIYRLDDIIRRRTYKHC